MTRTDGWRTDIRFLSRSLEQIHYDFYARADRDAFAAARGALLDEVPTLSDAEIIVGMMRLVRMAGDAHTHLFPEFVYRHARQGVPARLFDFAEGLHVAEVAPKHAELLGGMVLQIEGRAPQRVLDSVATIVSRDNTMWVRLVGADLLSFPQLLHALSLADSPKSLALTIRTVAGDIRSTTLPVEAGGIEDWQSVWHGVEPRGRQPAPRYWFEHLPDLDATYFQFNSVFNDEGESLPAFLDRLFGWLDETGEERLIIDLRENRGGNLHLAMPLVHGLIARPRFQEPGSLYVIVGRKTFSAAIYTAAQLERHVDPIFVGEPTGSPPNFVGETVYIRLPYSGLEPSISNVYWQASHGADYRTWIGPHLYAPPSIDAVLRGIDPALEAIRSDVGRRSRHGD